MGSRWIPRSSCRRRPTNLMDSLSYLLFAAGLSLLAYYGFEPVRNVLRQHVFRQRSHVVRELREMFIFVSMERLQTLKWSAAGLVSFLALILTWEVPAPGPTVACLLSAGVAYWTPELVVLVMRRRRRTAFSNQLVDGLMLLSNGLRSGFTLTQAFEMLVDEMPAPISQEFRLILEEMRLGVELDIALENSVARTKDPDLDLVVAAMKITRRLGGNLPEVFDRIVAMVRDRKVVSGKALALTASGRMQANVVGILPYVFAFIVAKLNPDLMKIMWTTPMGFMGLLLAVVLDAVGYFWVLKLSRIQY